MGARRMNRPAIRTGRLRLGFICALLASGADAASLASFKQQAMVADSEHPQQLIVDDGHVALASGARAGAVQAGNSSAIAAELADTMSLAVPDPGAEPARRVSGYDYEFPDTKISNPDAAAAADTFGRSVAVAGDTLVVGVPRDDTVWGSNAGSVRVYMHEQGAWVFQAELLPDDGGAQDFFGESVAIDGDTIAIGAPYWEIPGALSWQRDAGAVYVFTRKAGAWQQQARLSLPNSITGTANYLGSSVAVAGDFLIAGATGNSNFRGTVVEYERTAEGWVLDNGLDIPVLFEPAEFGYAVAMHDRTAVVTSLYKQGSTDFGKAYLYTRGESSWTFRYYLYPVNGTAADGFGKSVAISNHTILVGAYPSDSQVPPGPGSVFAYWSSGGEWRQRARFSPVDTMPQDRFGASVAIVGDNAVIGAPASDDPGVNQGAAYVFSRSSGSWQQETKLSDPAGSEGDGLARIFHQTPLSAGFCSWSVAGWENSKISSYILCFSAFWT
jgi:hypothetical protein